MDNSLAITHFGLLYQSFYELAALVNMRNPSAFELCRKFISDFLEESYLFDVWVLFSEIDKRLMNEILSQSIIDQVYENALRIAIQTPNSGEFDHSILYSAIKYNWDDVVDKLAENRGFVDHLQSDITYYGGLSDSRIILGWSLSSKKDLTQQLVMISKQNLDISTYLDELNLNLNPKEGELYKLDEKIKVEKSIQLAIAWKRSLET